jgi:threonine synthase
MRNFDDVATRRLCVQGQDFSGLRLAIRVRSSDLPDRHGALGRLAPWRAKARFEESQLVASLLRLARRYVVDRYGLRVALTPALTAQVRDSLMMIDASDNAAACHKTHMISGLSDLLAAEPSVAVTAGTCGNYGLALAIAARASGCPAVICVPGSYVGAQILAIRATGADVVLYGNTYEDAVEHSGTLAQQQGLLDCNPGGPHDRLLLAGLCNYLVQQLAELPRLPQHLWLPVGNGTTALAALNAIRELRLDCQLHAVTSTGNNSILASWRGGIHASMRPTDLRETHANEPLCNWRALHGDDLFRAAHGQVSVTGVSDAELHEAVRYLAQRSPIRYTPSAAAGFAGYRREDIDGTHAILLTARHAAEN